MSVLDKNYKLVKEIPNTQTKYTMEAWFRFCFTLSYFDILSQLAYNLSVIEKMTNKSISLFFF